MRRIFYDVETDSEHAAYANLTLVGCLIDDSEKGWNEDMVRVWEAPFDEVKCEDIRRTLCAPGIQRIGFNNLNYDDLVLHNHGITVPEEGTEDAMLAIKTCYPGLPAHALKFLLWYLLGDYSWDEFELQQTGHRFGEVPTDALKAYHREDLVRHKKMWDWIKDKVNELEHLDAYKLDMGMKLPLQEMTFEGGILVDVPKCKSTLADLQKRKDFILESTKIATGGVVTNANSNKQIGQYLAKVEAFDLDLTATGEFQVKKKDLMEIVGMSEEELRLWKPGDPLEGGLSPVAALAWQIRDNETLRKYVANYLKAAEGTNQNGWIPTSYSISRASTRRTLSKSYYKINFQTATEAIDKFKLIPKGYLGWFIDSTQIENVVHIYETQDSIRRAAYEADPDWNEYIWLCNRILGTNKNKKELDSIKSKQVPHWSVYKVYKTIKLALNFGMGIRKFCRTLGIDTKIGKALFKDIHRACPAIEELQDRVEQDLATIGYVTDTFGHIYTGEIEDAYKVVAYLIQGCGTGSLPKAQIKANYDTLHRWSEDLGINVGPLCTTTHDENSGLLRLDLGEEVLQCILKELMDNMTTKFTHKFDGIPLRAKLYLSTTNTYDKKEHEQSNINRIEFP